jgi:Protein of unknown function (DUF3592)
MYDQSHGAGKGRLAGAVAIVAGLNLMALVLVGLCIWVVTLGLSVRSQVEPVAGWRQTPGWVAGSQTVQTDRGPVYRPVVAFRAQDRVITFTAPITTSPPQVGSRAEVSYDPQDPPRAHDRSLGSAWEVEVYGGLVGAAITAGMAVVFCWLTVTRFRRQIRRAALADASLGGRHVRGSRF